jgi:hypothetical protein
MKKLIAIMLTVGLFAAPMAASAGGRGGYSGHGGHYGHGGYGVGGFFAGLVGGAILGTVLSNAYSATVYVPPPAYYSPPEQVWVPGRYVTRYERQWVPGHWEVERYSRHGEVYEDDDGYSRGRRIWVPGRYEDIRTRVWLPGHWEERG